MRTIIVALSMVMFLITSAPADVDVESIYLPPYIAGLDGVCQDCYDTFIDCELLTGDRHDRLRLSFTYGWSVRSIHPCWYEGECIMFQEDRESVFDWVKIKVLHRSRYLYIEEVTVTRACKNGQAFFIKSLATEAIYPEQASPTGYAYLLRVEEIAPPSPVATQAAQSLAGFVKKRLMDDPDKNGDGRVDILDFVKKRLMDDPDKNGDGRVDILDFVSQSQAPAANQGKVATTWGSIKNRR